MKRVPFNKSNMFVKGIECNINLHLYHSSVIIYNLSKQECTIIERQDEIGADHDTSDHAPHARMLMWGLDLSKLSVVRGISKL